MNFLAHLFLAGDTPESLIGNLAGDFVKGPLHERFTPGIRAGIMAHRKIDAFTDSHPHVAAFRRVLIPEHGHYSRVIADVFLDHFLACRFDEFGNEPLETFIDRTHATLDAHLDELPERLREVYPWMRDQRWLLGYRDVAGIELTLARMSHRIARRPDLAAATRHLVDSRGELERRFRAFFPEVVAYAKTLS
ncbi:MAG TPA: ACP phosphodiesterase [Thermoanaerobaculia bacterium]|jgi:acyl carrier protein phosphodiesterase